MKTKSGASVKSVLGVNCDDSFRVHHTRFVRIPQSVLDVSDIDEKRLELIPIFWTAPARAKEAAQQNYGLTLMYGQPGQQVERNVDLPRAPFNQPEYAEPTADAPDGIADLPAGYPEPETDEQAATRLKLEIDQKLQAIKEIDEQATALDTKRRKLTAEARSLGADLSRVQTGRLFEEKPDVPS